MPHIMAQVPDELVAVVLDHVKTNPVKQAGLVISDVHIHRNANRPGTVHRRHGLTRLIGLLLDGPHYFQVVTEKHPR